MAEHGTLNRTLKLLQLLSGIRHYSTEELCSRLEISERTLYRYLNTLRDTGYITEQEQGYYFIKRVKDNDLALNDLLHFSNEEACILNQAIMAIDDDNLLKANLRKKLYALYDFNRVADNILRPEQTEIIHAINTAVKKKQQVLLINYRSSHSQSIDTRCVEAFELTPNFQMIWAFEPASMQCKQFKTQRIEKVKISDKPWQYEAQHQKIATDPFRMASPHQEEAIIELTLLARNLLSEEYPLTEAYITKTANNRWIYQGPIRSNKGIGRFCMGLIDEVKVHQPASLVQYIEKTLTHAIKAHHKTS